MIKENCTLSDDNKGCPPGREPRRDFKSIEFPGDEIKWKGKVTRASGRGIYRVDKENIFRWGIGNSESYSDNLTGSKKLWAIVKRDPKYYNAIYVDAVEAKIGKDTTCSDITLIPIAGQPLYRLSWKLVNKRFLGCCFISLVLKSLLWLNNTLPCTI